METYLTSQNIDYAVKANEAYLNKSYKQCLVLLKHIPLDNNANISLSVNCAYDFWLTTRHDVDQIVKAKKLALVKESFSFLLGNADPQFVDSFQYIRLSHIYITEGALDGALRIMQLASARGHMEDVIIVTQTWSILRALGSAHRKDADHYMGFLVSAISLIDRPKVIPGSPACIPGSNLNLAAVYLQCVNHLKYLSKHDKTGKRRGIAFERLKALLPEAYYLANGFSPETPMSLMNWMSDSETWLNVGASLSGTPFLLLAEECFWESFLRDPRKDAALQQLEISMKNTNRSDALLALMTRAYSFFKSNMHCRDVLIQLEQEQVENFHKDNQSTFQQLARDSKRIVVSEQKDPPAKLVKFTVQFRSEAKAFAMMQAAVRRFLIRRRWPFIKEWHLEAKRNHKEKIGVAIKKHQQQMLLEMRNVLKTWKLHGRYLRLLKMRAAIIIQSLARRFNCRKFYHYKQHCVVRANALFVIASQMQYDFTRLRILRAWEKIYQYRRRGQATAIIVDVIRMHGFSVKFYAAMDMMCSAFRVIRKHSNKRIFYLWRLKYARRQRLHAKITIRFFVRGVFKRVMEHQRIAQQGLKIIKPEDIARLSYKLHQVPTERWAWGIWRAELQRKREYLARCRVAELLVHIFGRQKARRLVRRKRIRFEGQLALPKRFVYRTKAMIYFPWKRALFVRRLQQFARSTVAYRKLRRLRAIYKGGLLLEAQRQEVTFKRNLFLWSKFVHLEKRDRHRASRRIVFFFRQITIRNTIRTCVARRLRMYVMLEQFQKITLRFFLRSFRSASRIEHMRIAIDRVFRRVHVNVLDCSLHRMISQVRGQVLLMDCKRRFVKKRLEQGFNWKDVDRSVGIARPIDRPPCSFNSNRSEIASRVLSTRNAWESPVPTKHVLMNLSQYAVSRVFTCWMSVYRVRSLQKVLAAQCVAPSFLSSILCTIHKRSQKTVRIQCLMRQYLARQETERHRRIIQRHGEISIRIQVHTFRFFFREIHKLIHQRCSARRILQLFARRIVAKQRVQHRRDHQKRIHQMVIPYMQTSRFNRSSAKSTLQRMQFLYCHSIFLHSKAITIESHQRKLHPLNSISEQHVHGHKSNPLMSKTSTVTVGSPFLSGPLTLKYQLAAKQKPKSGTTFQSKMMNAGGGVLSMSMPNLLVEYNELTSSVHASSMINKSKPMPSRSPPPVGQSQAHSAVQQERPHFRSSSGAKDFHSHAYHTQLFWIQQSDVFIIDTEVCELSQKEMEDCCSKAGTVFIQTVKPFALRVVASHFNGSKVVLFGGQCYSKDMEWFLMHQDRKSPSKAITSLHINGCQLSISSCVLLAVFLKGSIRSVPDSSSTPLVANEAFPASKSFVQQEELFSHGNNCHIRELSIDSESLGVLGIVLILVAASRNVSIQTLMVTNSQDDWSPSIIESFRVLSNNSYLKELRIYGTPLTLGMVHVLLEAIINGFKGLEALEMTVAPEAEELSESLIQVSKSRLFGGQHALSISISASPFMSSSNNA